MSALTDRRCSNHPAREAVARCTSCGRFFCRECVTEHDDRMLCSSCLAAQPPETAKRRFGISGLVLAGQCMVSFFIAWACFYYLARMLMAIPAPLHEGTIWNPQWWGIQ